MIARQDQPEILAGHGALEYSVSTPFVVRIAGLPMSVLRRLRFSATVAHAEEALLLERWLGEQAVTLSDALHALIGTLAAHPSRPRLIALRRAIFQLKPPRSADLAAVADVLPADLAAAIRTWQERLARRAALLSSGDRVLEQEWAAKRRALQELARDQGFQQGLMLASRDLYEELQAWLGEDEPQPNRKLELGLMLYLTRMAAKTSPYSTFTSIAAGRWVAEGPALAANGRRWERRSSVELDRWTTNQIVNGLFQIPEIRAALPLRINSSLYELDNTLRFVVWRRGEVIVRVKRSPALEQILALLRSSDDPRYGQIVAQLTDDSPEQRAAVMRYLDQLISLGLLLLDVGVPDQSLDHLPQLLARLRAIHSPAAEPALALLATVEQRLASYAALPASERLPTLRAVYDALREVFQRLGLPDQGINVPGKNVFFEDSLVVHADVRVGRSEWDAPLADLALVQQLLGLYNPGLAGRLAMQAFIVDHYGPGARVPLLELYERFSHERQQPGGWRAGYRISGRDLGQMFDSATADDRPALPELAELERLRQQIPAAIARQPSDGPLLEIDRAQVRSVLATLPPFVQTPLSLAFYCQVYLADGRPQIVLNAVQSGFSRTIDRLRRLEARLGMPTATRTPADGDPLLVELGGVFGTNINLRLGQRAREIVYPGYRSARPAEVQLPLSDLLVVHDVAEQRIRLISQRLGRELVPLHLGLMGRVWLPPLYYLLIQLFGDGLIDPRPLGKYISLRQPQPDQPVQYQPRLCLGSVVVERAQWRIAVEQVPVRAKGESSFSYLLRLQRWRIAQQLPRQCFLRAVTSDKYRKPIFIDFDNYLAVLMLERVVGKAQQSIIIQEALPQPDQHLLHDGAATYVSECVFELTRQGASL